MVADTRMTVRDLYWRWETLRRFTRSWRAEKARLDHIVRLLGDREAATVNEIVWGEYVAARMGEPARAGQPPSAATLYLELVRAKQLLRWASRAGLIPSNPLDGVRAMQPPHRRETWLTWDQVERLLRAAQSNPWLYAWILVAVTTGMRISETLTLRHDRISGDGSVTIGGAQTKNGKKRIVALNTRTLQAIDDIPRNMRSVWVFWSRHTGNPIGATTVRRWFRKAVERAGLDAVVAEGDVRLRCHDARHTAASLLDAAGAHPTQIRDQLGHAKLATTERYLHQQQTDRALALAQMMDRKPPRRGRVTGTTRRDALKSEPAKNYFLPVKRDRVLS